MGGCQASFVEDFADEMSGIVSCLKSKLQRDLL